MNLKISFLVCQSDNNNEPFIFFKRTEENKYCLPEFEMPNDEFNVDEFVSKSFKSLTNVLPINKQGFGWINLFLSGTIVFNKRYSFVYICKIPEQIKIENYEKIKMSSILESNDFDEEYISQVIHCFNSLYIR